jgi:hypothetical protein
VNSVRYTSPPSDVGQHLHAFRTKERKGTSFTFKPARPGIYLIHARWWNNKEEKPIMTYISNPVVLMVKGK